MQIHELTKRQKQVDEGILDGIKTAVSAAKTGFNAGSSAAPANSKTAGTFGALGALTSPAAAAVARDTRYAAAGNKSLDKINKKFGLTGTSDAIGPASRQGGETKAGQFDDNELKQQATQMTQQFISSPTTAPIFADLSSVLPDPGQVLYVETPPQVAGGQPAKYYKDENGKWYNEKMQPIKGGAANLEQMIDNGKYGQSAKPASAAPAAPAPAANTPAAKTKKPAAGAGAFGQMAQSLGTQPAPAAAAPAVKPTQPAGTQVKEAAILNKKVMASLKKAKMAAMAQAGKTATAAQYRISPAQVDSNPATKAQIDQAQNQLAAASAIKVGKGKKEKVKQAYTNLAYATLKGIKDIGSGEVSPAAGGTGGGVGNHAGTTNPVVRNQASQTLKMLGASDTTLADLAKLVKNPKAKEALKTVASEQKQTKSLEQRLQEELSLISETQVHITKDIIVKTPSGEYVKRASDQEWYDPNGTLIDADKYADYVAKLDRTHQAQTQYQADEQKASVGRGPGGTDSGFQTQKVQQQAQQIKQVLPDVDPVALAAYKQELRAQLRQGEVSRINSQIQDTLTQLRNAQMFGTGQEQYLQQQLAGLMAMKV